MERMRVRDIMTSPALVIGPDATVPAAHAVMREHRIRHLPVVEDGRLTGIIAREDVLKALRRATIKHEIPVHTDLPQ